VQCKFSASAKRKIMGRIYIYSKQANEFIKEYWAWIVLILLLCAVLMLLIP